MFAHEGVANDPWWTKSNRSMMSASDYWHYEKSFDVSHHEHAPRAD
jgi:hypothetical protein